MFKKLFKWVGANSGYFAWAIALSGMASSLYFSELRHLPPCVLCWYQRISLYPLTFIIGVGLLKKDRNLHLYVLPLTLIGAAISIYHNLLYYKILPNSVAPCVAGISCTTKFIEYLGFVTIPLLSLTAFLTISVLMLIYHNYHRK